MTNNYNQGIRTIHRKVMIKPVDYNAQRGMDTQIYIPRVAQDKVQEGVVIAIDESANPPMEIVPGDIVLYTRHNHQNLTFFGNDLRIIKEANMIAVIGSIQ